MAKKRGRHSRPQKDGYQQQAISSREKEVETIILDRVTRRHGNPSCARVLGSVKGSTEVEG